MRYDATLSPSIIAVVYAAPALSWCFLCFVHSNTPICVFLFRLQEYTHIANSKIEPCLARNREGTWRGWGILASAARPRGARIEVGHQTANSKRRLAAVEVSKIQWCSDLASDGDVAPWSQHWPSLNLGPPQTAELAKGHLSWCIKIA
ncbi:hypothetical protein BDV93DRAFT_511508 [Ceratobasidium sp. AG-I]|nr:hypothetical protein BDV93DRAFT_511508 [Ceratobasidium sp. AG-I]